LAAGLQQQVKATTKVDAGTRLIGLANHLNITYWLIVLGSRLALAIPRWLSYGLAGFIGDLVFFGWREKRLATVANMRRVLGPGAAEARVRRAAQLSFRNYLKYTVDFLRFPGLTATDIKNAVEITGWQHLEQALSRGKGVIFVGIHFGHFDWGAATLAVCSYPVTAVVDTFHPARLNELIQRHRVEKGLNVIQLEAAGRSVLRVLRRREILGLLVDKPVPGQGVRVDFFGAPIEVPAGAATLSLRTGAPIIAGHIKRGDDGRFGGVIYPVIEIQPTGNQSQDVVTLTQRMMDVLSEMVHLYPEHWYMFRRLWPADMTASSISG
jgi:phosphatidylinositol dimannoside acyltransferase